MDLKKQSKTPKIASKGTDKLAKSFIAKLSQASSDTKYYYGEIKNQLLFLKGVKSRLSWKYESFNIKKVPIARVSIIGKTLCLFVNIKVTDLDAKYFAEDVSNIAKYQSTPTMVKVKSQRGLKFAKEIINEFGIEQRKNCEKYRVDYNIPYESTESLAQKGLVKTIKK